MVSDITKLWLTHNDKVIIMVNFVISRQELLAKNADCYGKALSRSKVWIVIFHRSRIM